MQAVIIHGPQGCGKTRHAKDFCELYGCTAWTDDWLPGEPLTPGLLHLTFEIPTGLPGRDVQIIGFDEAMKALGEKIVVRHLGTTTWQGPANQAPEFLGAQPGHNIAPVLTPAQMERLAFLIEECGEMIQEATKRLLKIRKPKATEKKPVGRAKVKAARAQRIRNRGR